MREGQRDREGESERGTGRERVEGGRGESERGTGGWEGPPLSRPSKYAEREGGRREEGIERGRKWDR